MAAASSPPRRPLAVRYSLRMLLLALTAFAIGFPIWYRWPYEEEEVQPPSRDPFAPPGETRIYTTWQRQWGGSRLKHGAERITLGGKTLRVTTYQLGEQTGLYQSFFVTGPLAEEGEYLNGENHGVCTNYNDDGSVRSKMTWKNGKLDGPATIGSSRRNQKRREIVFAEGQLVSVDDQPVADRLESLLAASKIDSPQIAERLRRPAGFESIDLPIESVAESIGRNFRIPVNVDPLHVNRSLRVSCNAVDIDLSAALTIMAVEHGLGCDYRFGCVWITSADDAEDWHDPTGINELVPPPDSQLAQSWNMPVAVNAKEQPLADELNLMTQPLSIKMDVSALRTSNGEGDSYRVTQSLSGHPFRHALGILLYQTRYRVKLDGETLVILPPTDGL